MKDLREKTGLPSSTINYYLRNGLLPKPVKTGKNMAWYPPSTISRLNLIKKLQEKNRLTIQEISEIVNKKDHGDELYVMETLHELVFGEISDRLYDREEFLKLSNLKEDVLDKLLELKVLIPGGNVLFDETDLFMAKFMTKLEKMGLNPEDLGFYPKAAEIISKDEMRLRKKLTADKSPEKNAEITSKLTDLGRKYRVYILERLFQEKILEPKA